MVAGPMYRSAPFRSERVLPQLVERELTEQSEGYFLNVIIQVCSGFVQVHIIYRFFPNLVDFTLKKLYNTSKIIEKDVAIWMELLNSSTKIMN